MYYDKELPKPSVEVAERMLQVLTAFRICRGGLRCSWEWARILEAASVGEKYPLGANTSFYKHILLSDDPNVSRSVWELIMSHIRLTPAATEGLMAHLQLINKK